MFKKNKTQKNTSIQTQFHKYFYILLSRTSFSLISLSSLPQSHFLLSFIFLSSLPQLSSLFHLYPNLTFHLSCISLCFHFIPQTFFPFLSPPTQHYLGDIHKLEAEKKIMKLITCICCFDCITARISCSKIKSGLKTRMLFIEIMMCHPYAAVSHAPNWGVQIKNYPYWYRNLPCHQV